MNYLSHDISSSAVRECKQLNDIRLKLSHSDGSRLLCHFSKYFIKIKMKTIVSYSIPSSVKSTESGITGST